MSNEPDGPNEAEEPCTPCAGEIRHAHRSERAAYAELGRMYQCWADADGVLHAGVGTSEDPLEAWLKAKAACVEAFEACDLACFPESTIMAWRRRAEALDADPTAKVLVKALVAYHKEHPCKSKS